MALQITAKLVKVLVDEAAPAAGVKSNEDSKPCSYKQLVKEQPFVEEFARKSYQSSAESC